MEKKNNDAALNNDLLTAHRSTLSSRTEENHLDDERRRLAVKYMTGRKLESQDSVILRQELERYEALVETAKLLEDLNPARNEDRIRWKSTLEDSEQVRSLIKSKSCGKDSSGRVWSRRNYDDRAFQNASRKSGENESDCWRIRKVSIRSHYDRFDDSPSKRGPASKRARTDDVGANRFERRAGLLKSENEACNSIQNRNKWERFEGNPRKSDPTSRTLRLENEEPTRRQNRWERTENDDKEEKHEQSSNSGPFRTAKAELHIQQQQQKGKKSLGGKASINSKFVCPLKREREEDKTGENCKGSNEPEDERLKGIDEKIIELIRNEIMDKGASISWDDVAGLEHAKKIIKEIVVLPMLRPDIFTGLRRPPKGILLFGPPGTGKTLIGKCIASQSKSTFFAISASSLTSKWIGEGEKMVRALFAVARVHQPSVIFIDEIDSLLTQRSETEHESSRRIKTEFLVQLDGAATGDEDRILVIGATNRPHELDEAARRRFVKRLYVPLPELAARRQIVRNLLAAIPHELTSYDIDRVAESSEHYSGADMTNLCKEASMGPIRCIPFDMLENIRKEDVRCVTAQDFDQALTFVRPSVSQSDLGLYVNWDRTYGSGTASADKK